MEIVPSANVIRPNSNSLVLHQSNVPNQHEMMVYHTMAEQAVTSKMYKPLGEKAGVMMIMLAARELGIPPMQALNGGLNIIQGKVEISAKMMNAMIRKAGHIIKTIETTETKCTLKGKRTDRDEEETVTYTLQEAQNAGLVKNGGAWTKCPIDMCYARALSRLARRLFSDVIGMGYVSGEISGNEAIEPIEASVDIQSELPNQIEVHDDRDVDLLHEYLELFQELDRPKAMTYLTLIQTHFKWTQIQTIREMMKDKNKLLEKFLAWKNKFVQATDDSNT